MPVNRKGIRTYTHFFQEILHLFMQLCIIHWFNIGHFGDLLVIWWNVCQLWSLHISIGTTTAITLFHVPLYLFIFHFSYCFDSCFPFDWYYIVIITIITWLIVLLYCRYCMWPEFWLGTFSPFSEKHKLTEDNTTVCKEKHILDWVCVCVSVRVHVCMRCSLGVFEWLYVCAGILLPFKWWRNCSGS